MVEMMAILSLWSIARMGAVSILPVNMILANRLGSGGSVGAIGGWTGRGGGRRGWALSLFDESCEYWLPHI
jgi:hypothetical protein